MKAVVHFPSEIEATVTAYDASGKPLQLSVRKLEISPNFFKSQSKAPLLYVETVGEDGEPIQRSIFTASGVNGKLNREDRTLVRGAQYDNQRKPPEPAAGEAVAGEEAEGEEGAAEKPRVTRPKILQPGARA